MISLPAVAPWGDEAQGAGEGALCCGWDGTTSSRAPEACLRRDLRQNARGQIGPAPGA